jgi:hypothetical protein
VLPSFHGIRPPDLPDRETRAEAVDVPAPWLAPAEMASDARRQASGTECAAYVNVPAGFQHENSQSADADPSPGLAPEDERVRPRP